MDINVLFKKFMTNPEVAQAFYSELEDAGIDLESLKMDSTPSQDTAQQSPPKQDLSVQKCKNLRVVKESVEPSEIQIFNQLEIEIMLKQK